MTLREHATHRATDDLSRYMYYQKLTLTTTETERKLLINCVNVIGREVLELRTHHHLATLTGSIRWWLEEI